MRRNIIGRMDVEDLIIEEFAEAVNMGIRVIK